MHTKYTPKYMVSCEVVTPHVIAFVRRLRFKFKGRMLGGISVPSFDHITFGQPFVTSYEEASRISVGIDLVALRLTMGEHIFSLGEARFFESESVDTLYLEVDADDDVAEFLMKMRTGLFTAHDITMLGPRLDDGKPKLHITLLQGKGLAKKSKRLLRDIEQYNRSLQVMRKDTPDKLVVFESFIPIVYAKYRTGWKILSRDPERAP